MLAAAVKRVSNLRQSTIGTWPVSLIGKVSDSPTASKAAVSAELGIICRGYGVGDRERVGAITTASLKIRFTQ